jgi:branched-chain amino acid transport system permease protein
MSRRGAWATGFAMLIFLLIAPRMLGTYHTGLLSLMLIFGIFAMSLDILQGYAGLPSLGHAAFWGTSAYVVGILNTRLSHGAYFALEMISGVLASATLAALLGLIVLRSREIYLLMILLASSMMLWGLAFKWRTATGGDDGLPGIERPHLGPSGWDLSSQAGFYYFALTFFIVSTALMYLVVRSSFGHTLLGIRENEARMSSLGYNVWAHKYIAFIISAVFAGLAGSLIAYYNGYVSPTELHLVTSAEALIMVILGGAGTLFGPAVGACLILLIKNVVSGYTEHWMIILGMIYMLTGLVVPHGLLNLFKLATK